MSFAAIPAYGGEGFEIPPRKQNRIPKPTPGRQHQWVCHALYTISDRIVHETAAAWMSGAPDEGIHLDHENLTAVMGPVCMKCDQQLNPTTYAQPCPVNVTYLHDPNCGCEKGPQAPHN